MKIIYDFDGTLTPYPIPKYKILEKCGIQEKDYYSLIKEIKNQALLDDNNMFEMFYTSFLEILKTHKVKINNQNLSYGADNLEYNKGLLEFLEYTANNQIENYIVSSGIKVYLEKTKIAKYFKEIYGTTFKDENIDYLMTDDDKVGIIKSICNDNCTDTIYIGDGLTDCKAFQYVYNHGGKTIYINHKHDFNMSHGSYISYVANPDYSLNNSLARYIILQNNNK